MVAGVDGVRRQRDVLAEGLGEVVGERVTVGDVGLLLVGVLVAPAQLEEVRAGYAVRTRKETTVRIG